jgi:hypothetical protein
MKMIVMFVSMGLMLMGCATTAQYQNKLDALVGQPKEALISQWGEPTGVYTDENGNEVLAYIRTRSVIVPGARGVSPENLASQRIVVIPDRPTEAIPLTCMTKFTLTSGVVRSFTFKGNDCKAQANPAQSPIFTTEKLSLR